MITEEWLKEGKVISFRKPELCSKAIYCTIIGLVGVNGGKLRLLLCL